MPVSDLVSLVGGAGFIGTRVARRLAALGHPFEIIDLKPSRSFPAESRIADIRNLDALRGAIRGRHILHLAAVHRDDVADLSQYQTTNVEGTRNVCAVADAVGAERIVFTSSVAVYGFAPIGTGEDGAIAPVNEYGRTKWQAEEVLQAWHAADPARKGLVIVRPTVVFGEGNRGNVYNLLKQVVSGRFLMVGAGHNRKSMAYVENVAEFLCRAVLSPVPHLVVNYVDEPDFDMNSLVTQVRAMLGKGEGVGPRLPYGLGLMLGHAADLVSRATGRPLPVSAIRVRKFCASTSFSSAKARLDGFEAPVTIADGLRRTVDAEFLQPDPSREIFFTE